MEPTSETVNPLRTQTIVRIVIVINVREVNAYGSVRDPRWLSRLVRGGGGGSNIAWIHVIRSPVLLLLRRGMTTECAAPRMDTCDWQPK